MPSASDLTITRLDNEALTTTSPLTRGRCATVFLHPNHRDNLLIVPSLIPSYMHGLNTDIIRQAAETFLQTERTRPCR